MSCNWLFLAIYACSSLLNYIIIPFPVWFAYLSRLYCILMLLYNAIAVHRAISPAGSVKIISLLPFRSPINILINTRPREELFKTIHSVLFWSWTSDILYHLRFLQAFLPFASYFVIVLSVPYFHILFIIMSSKKILKILLYLEKRGN